MIRKMAYTFALLTALIITPNFAQAESSVAKDDILKFVPAQHNVVIGIDVQKALNSDIVQQLKQELPMDAFEQGIADIEAFTGFNVERDLHQIYVSNVVGNDGDESVYLRGKFDIPSLIGVIQFNADYAYTEHEGVKIHYWYDEKDGDRYGCFVKKDLLVIGPTREKVVATLKAKANSDDAMGGKKAARDLQAKIQGEPVAWALAIKGDVPMPNTENNPVIKQLKSALVTIDIEKSLKLAAVGETASEELSKNFCDMLNGLVALGRINQEQPDLQMLAEATKISQDGKYIRLTVDLPMDKFRQAVSDKIRENQGL